MTHYLFALTDAGGTVPPELGVVRRILDRGHRVVVLGDASMAAEVTATGAEWRAWTYPAPAIDDWRRRTPTALARGTSDQMFAGPAPGHARDTTRAIEELGPDVVVTSFVAVGAMIAAEASGLPVAVLIPNVYPLPAPGLPPFGAGLAPARGPLGRVRDTVMTAASTRLLGRYALEPLNAVRRAYDLPPLSTAWGQHERAQLHLVLTAAAFDFPARLPANVRYAGPVLDDPAWADDVDWQPPPGDGPLVLVAMSSTFQDHVDCLQRITDALGALGVRGVVTTGPAVDPGRIRASARVEVVRSLPHRLVLPHADVVVTHGGHGTVVKALAAGVPLVVLHHGRDQADNARRLTSRGAGVAISRRSGSARIARAVRQVLADDGFRSAARELGEAVRADAGSDAVVTELEGVAAAR